MSWYHKWKQVTAFYQSLFVLGIQSIVDWLLWFTEHCQTSNILYYFFNWNSAECIIVYNVHEKLSWNGSCYIQSVEVLAERTN